MTVDEISLAAATGIKIADSEPPEERALYWQLVVIYRDYANSKISQAGGASAKTAAVQQFKAETSSREIIARRLDSTTQLWRHIESAASAYALGRTLDNADRLWSSIYNLPDGSRPTKAAEIIKSE